MNLEFDNILDDKNYLEMQKIEHLLKRDILDYTIQKGSSALAWDLSKELYGFGEQMAKEFGIENIMYDVKNEIFDLIEKQYWGESDTLSDMNKESFLYKLKQNISDNTKRTIEETNQFDDKNLVKINEYVDTNISKIVDDFAKKYFNNRYRDKMEDLQNKWHIAYENKNYEQVNKLSGQMRRAFNNGYYKDYNLEYQIVKSFYIDTLLDYKRKKGEPMELTDIDKKVIDARMNLFTKDYDRKSNYYFTQELADALKSLN